MNSKRVACCLIACLLICPVLTVAHPGGQISPGSSSGGGQEKLTEAQKALQTKALGLLRQIVADSSNLGLAENRIRVQLTAAELLWSSDDKQARDLLVSAAAQLAQLASSEVAGNSEEPDDEMELPMLSQFRREIVLTAASHDPDLALDLLKETKLLQPNLQGMARGRDPDYQLELTLASQLAESSPAKALQIAEDDLRSRPLSYELINLLSSLSQAKDSQYATKLAGDINSAIQGATLASDLQAANVASGLLSQALASDSASNGQDGSGNAQNGAWKQPLLSKEQITALIEKVSSYTVDTLTSAPRGTLEWNIAQQVLNSLSESISNIQKYDAQAAAAMSQKLAAVSGPVDQNSQIWTALNQLVTTGTVQDILTAAETEPASVRQNFYQQAVWKAVNSGDVAQARQIAEQHISDPNQRDQTLNAIAQNAAQHDLSNGKIETALDLIGKIRGREDRCGALLQLAESEAVRKGDKKVGLGILDQVRTLLPPQPQNYTQLQMMMRLGADYSKFDSKRGLDMVSQVATRLNSLTAAAQTMEGFDILGNFKDGELVIQPRTQLTTSLQLYGEGLGELAANDFDGAVVASALLDRADSRILVELGIVSRVLGSEGGAVQMVAPSGRVEGFIIRD